MMFAAPPYDADARFLGYLLDGFAEDVQPMWKYSADVDADFEATFLEACVRHGWDPLAMLSCWNSESSVEPRAMNRGGWASGIYQLMPDTAHGLGWLPGDIRWAQIGDLRAKLHNEKDSLSSEEKSGIYRQISDLQHALMLPYVAMSASQQVAWAERFYGPHGEMRTAAACYVTTFLPALLPHAHEPSFVLCARNGPYSEAYAGNHAAFDPDGKGYITVQDLTDRIERAAVGPRWQELVDRVRGAQQGRQTDPEIVAGDERAFDEDNRPVFLLPSEPPPAPEDPT